MNYRVGSLFEFEKLHGLYTMREARKLVRSALTTTFEIHCVVKYRAYGDADITASID